jgi:hypothetical protein
MIGLVKRVPLSPFLALYRVQDCAILEGERKTKKRGTKPKGGQDIALVGVGFSNNS